VSAVHPADLPGPPARGLIVVSCMDSRIDPLRVLGLEIGEAHVLRNAGAEVTDDVLRSAQIAYDAHGCRDAWVVAHSRCAANGEDDQKASDVVRVGAQNLRDIGYDARPRFYDLVTGQVRDL
jgi:carbonic anhydrase